MYFNSIKVRLELRFLLGFLLLGLGFQFHKGTIRTNHPVYLLDKQTDFNSIKVRLELSALHLFAFLVELFQFHKGTIRTRDKLFSFLSSHISIP